MGKTVRTHVQVQRSLQRMFPLRDVAQLPEPRSTELPTVYAGPAGHQSCPYAHERLRKARSAQVQFIRVPR